MSKVFANHAHVFEAAVKPNGTIDCLKQAMDMAGIDKAVCFAPFVTGRGTQMSSRDLDQNEWLAASIKGDPDLYGFGTVNFDAGDLRGQVEKIADLGFKGIKLHPAHQEFRVNGPKAYEVYRAAERLGLFLSFHTGVHYYRLSEYQMLLFDDLTFDFPDLKFSMEHMGGHCFFKDALAVMTNRRYNAKDPHIFAGWTSIYTKGNWHLSDEELDDLVTIGGPLCQCYGLDFPYKKSEAFIDSIARVRGLNIPEETKDLILGGNLARELHIQL